MHFTKLARRRDSIVIAPTKHHRTLYRPPTFDSRFSRRSILRPRRHLALDSVSPRAFARTWRKALDSARFYFTTWTRHSSSSSSSSARASRRRRSSSSSPRRRLSPTVAVVRPPWAKSRPRFASRAPRGRASRLGSRRGAGFDRARARRTSSRRGEARRGDRGSRANRIACVDDNSRVARVAVLNDIGVVGVVDVHFLDDDGFLLLLGRLGRHALGAALEIDGGLAR
jgi:hypothetical protein